MSFLRLLRRSGLLAVAVASIAIGRARGDETASQVERHGSRVHCVNTIDPKSESDADLVAAEEHCFAAAAGTFRRQGDDLAIRLGAAASLVLSGNLAACDAGDDAHCVIASVECFDLTARYAIIKFDGYEKSRYVFMSLVDGAMTDINEKPMFSPAGDQFVTVNGDMMNDHALDIEIFWVEGNTIEAKYLYSADSFSPRRDESWSFVTWIDEGRISLSVKSIDAIMNSAEPISVDLVRYVNGTWQLENWPR